MDLLKMATPSANAGIHNHYESLLTTIEDF